MAVSVARWRHNFAEVAVENCENSKNQWKIMCALLHTDTRGILIKFH